VIGHCPACKAKAVLTIRNNGKTRCGWCHAEWTLGGPVTRARDDKPSLRLPVVVRRLNEREQADRAERARDARRRGYSWRIVAAEVGYSTAAIAEKAVRRLNERERAERARGALDTHRAQAARDARRQGLSWRLVAMHAGYGDQHNARRAVSRLIEQERRAA